jgi:hypothetical protein
MSSKLNWPPHNSYYEGCDSKEHYCYFDDARQKCSCCRFTPKPIQNHMGTMNPQFILRIKLLFQTVGGDLKMHEHTRLDERFSLHRSKTNSVLFGLYDNANMVMFYTMLPVITLFESGNAFPSEEFCALVMAVPVLAFQSAIRLIKLNEMKKKLAAEEEAAKKKADKEKKIAADKKAAEDTVKSISQHQTPFSFADVVRQQSSAASSSNILIVEAVRPEDKQSKAKTAVSKAKNSQSDSVQSKTKINFDKELQILITTINEENERAEKLHRYTTEPKTKSRTLVIGKGSTK